MCSRICKHNYRITIIVKIGYHDHSPAGLVVTGVTLARDDMHSPRATVKHTPCCYTLVYMHEQQTHTFVVQIYCQRDPPNLLPQTVHSSWYNQLFDSSTYLLHVFVLKSANVSLRLRRSKRVFLQLQFEAFYTVNLLNAKWKVVPARNSGWKKRVPI